MDVNQRISTCNRLDLQTLGSQPVIISKISPITGYMCDAFELVTCKVDEANVDTSIRSSRNRRPLDGLEH